MIVLYRFIYAVLALSWIGAFYASANVNCDAVFDELVRPLSPQELSTARQEASSVLLRSKNFFHSNTDIPSDQALTEYALRNIDLMLDYVANIPSLKGISRALLLNAALFTPHSHLPFKGDFDFYHFRYKRAWESLLPLFREGAWFGGDNARWISVPARTITESLATLDLMDVETQHPPKNSFTKPLKEALSYLGQDNTEIFLLLPIRGENKWLLEKSRYLMDVYAKTLPFQLGSVENLYILLESTGAWIRNGKWFIINGLPFKQELAPLVVHEAIHLRQRAEWNPDIVTSLLHERIPDSSATELEIAELALREFEALLYEHRYSAALIDSQPAFQRYYETSYMPRHYNGEDRDTAIRMKVESRLEKDYAIPTDIAGRIAQDITQEDLDSLSSPR